MQVPDSPDDGPTIGARAKMHAANAATTWAKIHDPDPAAHPADTKGPCLECPAIPERIDEAACSTAIHARAQRRYEAYNANSGWLNYQGNRCPAWPDLTSAVRSHWCATIVDDYR